MVFVLLFILLACCEDIHSRVVLRAWTPVGPVGYVLKGVLDFVLPPEVIWPLNRFGDEALLLSHSSRKNCGQFGMISQFFLMGHEVRCS